MKRRPKPSPDEGWEASGLYAVETRAEYELQCKVRRGDCSADLHSFLTRFPILYVVCQHGHSEHVFHQAEDQWSRFVQENKPRLVRDGKVGDNQYFRLSPLEHPRCWSAAKLIHLHKMAESLLFRLSRFCNEHGSGEFAFGMRLPTFVAPNGALPIPNPEYFGMVKRETESFCAQSKQFRVKWGFHPHEFWVSDAPLVISKEQAGRDKSVRLVIPVGRSLTMEQLTARWSEVVLLQRLMYGPKQRESSVSFGQLLYVYDQAARDLPLREIAAQLNVKCGAIRKQLARVRHDVGDERQHKVGERRQRRTVSRSDRVNRLAVAASEEETIRRVSMETGIPVNKILAPESLTETERSLLRESLETANRDHQLHRIR